MTSLFSHKETFPMYTVNGLIPIPACSFLRRSSLSMFPTHALSDGLYQNLSLKQLLTYGCTDLPKHKYPRLTGTNLSAYMIATLTSPCSSHTLCCKTLKCDANEGHNYISLYFHTGDLNPLYTDRLFHFHVGQVHLSF